MNKINSISFIIPVFNEVNTLKKILYKIEKANLGLEKEIILIDDCSIDGTKEVIENLRGDYKKIHEIINCGKGAAIRKGIQAARGDLIVIQDADLEYDPEDIKDMIKPILAGEADVVYGSRFLSGRIRRVLFFWHMVGNKALTLLSNMVSNITLTDMETGYKLFKSDIIKNIKIEENRFGFEPEITMKISQMNCRIYEVGISYYGRDYAQGKKITWKDGVIALKCIVKYGIIRRIFTKEPLLEKFLRKFRFNRIRPYIKEGQIVCDIGCGKDMFLLRSISRIAHSCIGIDKNVSSIEYSNISIKNLELDDKIQMESESVDVVVLAAVLEHLEKPAQIIQEIRRILKPNGLLLITVPTKKLKPLLEFMAYTLYIISAEQVRDHKQYFTSEKLKKLLFSNGFLDIEIEYFELGLNIFCVARKIKE